MQKTVLFTGATGGLGEICVKALSATNRWLVLAAGTNETKLAELASLTNVIPIPMDITDGKSVQAAFQTAAEKTQTLDAIVNFAGRSAMTSMAEGDCVETAQALLDVNVMGMIRVNRVFFDLLYRGKGRIINCSSEAGWMTSQPFAAPYFLSKRAVEAYSDSLRRELMFLGIPVIKIQPGSYKTNMTQSTLNGFHKTLQETRYYKEVLTKLKPLMTQELSHGNDPQRLADLIIHVLDAKHPKLRYRIGTGKQLLLLELLPEKCVDLIYKAMLSILKPKV